MNRTDDPKKQPIPFGVNGPREDIGPTTPTGDNSASYNSGFPPITMLLKAAGGLPPKGQDMNQILYELSSLARWASAGALNVFDSTFSSSISGYPKGAVLSNSTFTGCWLNTTDANTANPENTDGTLTGWVPAFTYGTTAVTGLAAANVTLTALQAANERITLAGVLTANINLIFPSWRKEWVVVNNCTGSFSVTCKTPGGTGIAVAAGGSVRIIGDGTNIISNESSLITGALQKSANLSDLQSTSTARTNLGLGGAAVLNVGTTVGTVAAGDDPRITASLLKANNLSDLTNVPAALLNLGLGDVIRKSDTNVQLPGQLTTKGNIKSTEGDLYSGDARLAHDGNIFGTVWGDSLFHYLEGKLPKVTTVYINTGTPESPYQYPVRSRQTFGNPFPGRIIECKAELFINNIWGPTGFIYSSDNSWGVTASPFDNSARIVVQSGRTGTAAISENAGGVHGISNNVNSPLPIRLKVWTVD
ncbi:TPA: hypothetical protein ACMVL8_002436 [Yersinia enterocolitica]|nr:hypothetical protein [Yersinia enterocolitica]